MPAPNRVAPNDALAETMLDRSRPYSPIYGESSYRYEQDGLRFDGGGRYCGRNPGWKPALKSAIPDSGGGLAAVLIKLRDLNLRAEANRAIHLSDNARLAREYTRLTGLEWRGKREGLIKAIRTIYRRVVEAVSRQIPEAIITDWESAPSQADNSDLEIAALPPPPEDPDEEGEGDETPENPDEVPDGDAPPVVEFAETQLAAGRQAPASTARVGRLPSRNLEDIADAAGAARDAGVQAGSSFNESETF